MAEETPETIDKDLLVYAAEWRASTNGLKDLLAQHVTNFYGERCPEFEPSCGACTAWWAFDFLMLNLFDETERNKLLDMGLVAHKDQMQIIEQKHRARLETESND